MSLNSLAVDLKLSREVEHVGERQYLVTVAVIKEGLQGYAKLEESVPEGFTAHKVKTRSANYIFRDGKAKFIWMDLPKENSFKVSYKLIQKRSEPGTFSIQGRFSCVSGDDLIRVSESSSFEVEAPKPVASHDVVEEKGSEDEDEGKEEGSEEDETSEEEDEIAHENGEEDEEGASDSVSNSKTVAESDEDEESEGIARDERFFSVQIGAFSEKKPRSYFSRRFGVTDEKINLYTEGGLHKYSIGRYSDYQEANEAKKRFRSEGANGAFVIGFEQGEAVSASALLE